MIKKAFILCSFFFAICVNDSYSQNSTDSLKIASIEDLSRELDETNKHLNHLLAEIESRIVSDTLTQIDLNMLVKALLQLDTPRGYQLILKHYKRYVRKDTSTNALAQSIKTGKAVLTYTIWDTFRIYLSPHQYARFVEFLYQSDYLSEPIPEDDLEFIRSFLRDYAYSNREEDVHGIRKENLRRIRALD